jgi:hypothetical protein
MKARFAPGFWLLVAVYDEVRSTTIRQDTLAPVRNLSTRWEQIHPHNPKDLAKWVQYPGHESR